MDPEEVPPVLEEVQHRRVGKVVVTYLAVAFAVLEASASFMPGDAPEWAARGVLGVLVLGFPVTVVLGWIYDITPRGVVRTPDDLSGHVSEPTSRAWLVLTVLGVLFGAALHVTRG